MQTNEDVFVYRTDSRDIIVEVTRNWESFARLNGCGDESRPEKGVGRLLWDFIQGFEALHLYEDVFRRIRADLHGSKPAQ